MSRDTISFLSLPNEILHKILLLSFDNDQDNFVLKTEDLTNVSKLSLNLGNLLLMERTSILFDSVFKHIKKYLPEEDLFKCRRTCKRWKCTIDKFLTQERYIGKNKRFDPHEVLGVEIGASIATAKRAALDKIIFNHPDKGGSHIESVNIILAKKILTNQKYRMCFRDCHKSPLHLKAAWQLYERARASDESEEASESE